MGMEGQGNGMEKRRLGHLMEGQRHASQRGQGQNNIGFSACTDWGAVGTSGR